MTVYAINARTLAMSEYSWSSLKGIVSTDTAVYALNSTQLLKHTGLTDDETAISPYIITGALTPAGNQRYNAPKMTLAVEGTGTVTVTAYTAEEGVEQTSPAHSLTLQGEQHQFELILGTKESTNWYQFKFTLGAVGSMLERAGIYINPVRHNRG